MNLNELLHQVQACTHCHTSLPFGPNPVVVANPTARLLIIGQAPGTRVHETGIPWHDKSGDRLRDWLDISPDDFYDPQKLAIMPMGFCYPGVNAKGGDMPPRPECAPLWHHQIRAHLPNIELTLLIGQYAQKYYLGQKRGKSLTDTVKNWQNYLPAYLPLPHPSWRTLAWQRKNPWFETQILPALRKRIGALIA